MVMDRHLRSNCYEFALCTSLGISEAKRLVFNMYPNPSSDLVQIEPPTGTTEAEAGF